MYCRHCGKELSDEAFMCPNCGTLTGADPVKKQTQKETPETSSGSVNTTALAAVAFLLSMLAFVTGIIFGAFCYVTAGAMLFLYIFGASTILPAVASLSIGTYLLVAGRDKLSNHAKGFAITSVVLSAFILVFLFLTGCILVPGAMDY